MDNKLMRRPRCTTCLRAQSACICRWITLVAHTTQVLILQHPMEVHNAKGSARLLHLSLPGSRLIVGETWAVDKLKQLIFAPFSATGLPIKQTVLLYPAAPLNHTVTTPLDSLAAHLESQKVASGAPLQLVVIDATWRKSRKMLHLNPFLAHLPRLSLNDTATSRYSIRRAHRPDQLSTLEATCAALAQLESNGAAFLQLLSAFDGFVAQQLSYATPASMVRNH